MTEISILDERKKQIFTKGNDDFEIKCESQSVSGSVSQRACVFCGSRVVLYPIADALHLVHGPIGCAAYTWDIRGALSSGPQLHRLSFSTDLRETNVIFGGEKKLYSALKQLIGLYTPKAAFVYATCIVGVIGDDVDSICRKVTGETGIPVIPVHSEGFKGTKKDGYAAACQALFTLFDNFRPDMTEKPKFGINILGEFNIGGEAWIIKEYYRKMGVNIISVMTGDGRVDDIRNAPLASLNVVQCSGSMTGLAKMMKEKYGIPYIQVSYFGVEDTAKALYDVAEFFGDSELIASTSDLIKTEVGAIHPEILSIRRQLEGRKAAVYVGGAFKAFSLLKALKNIGMDVVVIGSQTGAKDDYKTLKEICDPGTIIVDDASSLELAKFIVEKKADLVIGGVKERPIAYKMGIGFCDHNHERKIPLAGFEGMLHFAREVRNTVLSPVWKLFPSRNEVKNESSGKAA